MGQKRFVAIDLSQEENEHQPKIKPSPVKVESVVATPEPQAKTETPVLSATGKDISHLVEDTSEVDKSKKSAAKTSKAKKPAPTAKSTTPKATQHVRSHRYQHLRSLVDRTKTYPLSEAIKLVKTTSLSRFDGSVEAHLNVTETGLKAQVSFPHSTGRTTRVAIADDKLIEQIAAGKIDFDILLSTPQMMSSLAKYAKILGPKGLMPSPKTDTITQNPEKKKQELEGGKTLVRTEPKAPLMHLVVGKVSMKESELAANLETLIQALAPKNITKLTLSATMGPGIKVDLSEFKR